MSFKDKVILITGASSGIGAACAQYFAKQEALLALVGRNAERFEKVVKKIKESGVEREPLVILADVSIDSELIIGETIKKYERLDILINNAGVAVPGTIETTKIADFDSIMATNVRGVFMLTQLAVPYLISSKGNVVNVSSVAGMRTIENLLSYCISKAALDHLTRCVAFELAGKGVRVNSVNPAAIDTNPHDNLGLQPPSLEQIAAMGEYGKMHPMGRVGTLAECVNAIVMLASDNASFITGVTMPVDGGMNIKSPLNAMSSST